MYAYLLIDLFSLALPLAYILDKRLSLHKNFPALLVALLIPAILFIAWDVVFTEIGVWGFEPKYLVGIDFLGLPLEELLFFLAIPYCCLFTYEVVLFYFKGPLLVQGSKWIMLALAVLAAIAAFIWKDQYYTFYTSLYLLVFCAYHAMARKEYLGKMLLAYVFILVPFLLVNGLLTGVATEYPIVWYDNAQNIGFRILTIPVEDVFYGFVLIGSNITLYERFRKP